MVDMEVVLAKLMYEFKIEEIKRNFNNGKKISALFLRYFELWMKNCFNQKYLIELYSLCAFMIDIFRNNGDKHFLNIVDKFESQLRIKIDCLRYYDQRFTGEFKY